MTVRSLKKKKTPAKKKRAKRLLKLDLGCGTRKNGPEWIGVDVRKFKGVDKVCDLTKRWPWKNESVDEVYSSHFIEHLVPKARIHFANELYRVLKPGAKATIVVPYWASVRAYGDLSHEWPPVVQMWFAYLDKDWRKREAPHSDKYRCDFPGTTFGLLLRPELQPREAQHQTFAVQNYIEAAQDLIANMVKPKRKSPK